jgi:hypothetical protein
MDRILRTRIDTCFIGKAAFTIKIKKEKDKKSELAS